MTPTSDKSCYKCGLGIGLECSVCKNPLHSTCAEVVMGRVVCPECSTGVSQVMQPQIDSIWDAAAMKYLADRDEAKRLASEQATAEDEAVRQAEAERQAAHAAEVAAQQARLK